MNTNELTDWLDNIADSKDWGELKKYYKRRLKNAATMLLQQQAEIDSLKKFIAESNALDKKLHESIQKANELWGNATKSILKKAKK